MAVKPILQLLLDKSVTQLSINDGSNPPNYIYAVTTNGVGPFLMTDMYVYGSEQYPDLTWNQEPSSNDTYSNTSLVVATFSSNAVKAFYGSGPICEYVPDSGSYPGFHSFIYALSNPLFTYSDASYLSKIYVTGDFLVHTLIIYSVDQPPTLQFGIFPREAFFLFKDIITLYSPVKYNLPWIYLMLTEITTDISGFTQPSTNMATLLNWYNQT